MNPKSKKGQLLAIWRRLMYGRVHNEAGNVCGACRDSALWGYRCCWECDRFHLCYPKWEHDYLSSEKTRYCPYSEEKFKHCEIVYDMYKNIMSE